MSSSTHKHDLGDNMGACARAGAGMKSGLDLHGRWDVVCRDKHGNIKWTDHIDNLVVDAGVNYALDAALSGGAAITTWYLGLADGTPTADAADIMSSHAGWVEVQNYDEAVRQTWSDGGVSGKSVSNSASAAVFTIDTNATTMGGCFLTSVSTKGGTTGTLYAIGAFSAGDKVLDDNDTLTVTATFTG
jgi:hypothetical protein